MMYKNRCKSISIIIAFIMNFCSVASHAQHDSSAHSTSAYITAAAGIGISPRTLFLPSGNSTWNDYVMPGYSFSCSGGIPVLHLHKVTFGILALFGYYSNWFNMDKYMNCLTSTDPNKSTYSKSQSGAYTQYSVLGGAYATCIIGKTTFELSVMGGLAADILPNASYFETYAPPVHYSILITQTFSAKAGAGLDAGVQVNYPLGKSMSATFGCHYLMSSCNYTNTMYEGNNPNGFTSAPLTAYLQMINALAGLTYSFGK